MSLSPSAIPFFSCTSSYKLAKRDHFLCKAKNCLSPFDCNLFCEILMEWESSLVLHSCFSLWQELIPVRDVKCHSSLRVLSFNVRGLDLRWHEVLLLISSFKLDILILLETGVFDSSFMRKIFSGYKSFYQKGENRNGGVLLLVKDFLGVKRVPCNLPNVCAIDIQSDEDFRLIGVYAPESKTWVWDDLSPFLSKKCIVYGDFNVDFTTDGSSADALTHWAGEHFLAHVIPNSSTSLRSSRVIDYAFTRGIYVTLQVYDKNTTSDHFPLISMISLKNSNRRLGKNVHWKVFSLFSEFTFSYWEERWDLSSLDITYNDYIRFLSLLSIRCTSFFDLNNYRSALPMELRSFLSYIRALSFRHSRSKCPFLKKEVLCLRRYAKHELNRFFSSQLDSCLRTRYSSSPAAVSFWCRSKHHIKPSSSSLNAFIDSSGKMINDSERMCDMAADYYEDFFKSSNIVRPHPYTDAPPMLFDNEDEIIPEVTHDEILSVILPKRKKKSLDAHGVSSYMFNHLDINHWSLFVKLFNLSLRDSFFPTAWKETRMILLAKKEPICLPSSTRPISIIDSFQKVAEKLFLNRFRDLLWRRGLLPDNQSGFREGFRLQSRLLLFLEDIRSLMSNSSPVCTMFVDFRKAFDQLWFLGCIGKFRNLGIPPSYLNWIYSWLTNRRCYIEINGKLSRWFNIEKGGPQGSVLTPTVFITYNCDMGIALSGCASHFFADDLAGIVAGQMGVKYTKQCLDLQKRVGNFLKDLDYYSCLTDQPINTDKTETLFSARAVGGPKFEVSYAHGGEKIRWVSQFKYLGYLISPKMGWGILLKDMMLKVRNRISLIRSFRLFGCSSAPLRKTLFSCFVLPLFTWIYPIFPFLSLKQQYDLSHFYFSSLRRVLFGLQWNVNFFAFALDEISLEDRCALYWEKFLISLADSIDGRLLLEMANLNMFRENWVDGLYSIKCLRKSKRFVPHESAIRRVVKWLASNPSHSSILSYEIDEIQLLENFPDSFLP